jgi:hypothetical protein
MPIDRADAAAGDRSDGSSAGDVLARPVPADGVPPSPAPQAGVRTRAVWATALVVASYTALGVAVYWDAWSTGVSSHLQLGGDQFANVWFLQWTPFAILHGHNPLFTTYANVPFGVNLATNTSAPLLGVLGLPVTVVAGSIATFNIMSTMALAGSATAGYAFARRWTTWRPAAWAAGLLYGFSPYQLGQSNGHLNLTFVVLPPLILLVLAELAVRQAWSPRLAGVVLGLLVSAQFFVSSEILVSTVIIGAVCVVTVSVIGRHEIADHLRSAVRGILWAGGVAGALLAYPVWFAVQGPGSISGPIQLVPEAYRADVLGLITPGAYVWIAPTGLTRISAHFASSVVENDSYLGITLVVTVVVSVVLLWKRSLPVRVAAVGAGVAYVLSLGGALAVRSTPGALLTGFPLPERVFTRIPLLSNTVPVRYSLYVALFASLILAVALDRIHARVRARTGGGWLRSPVGSVLLPALVGLGCLVPLIPSLPLRGFGDPGIPAYFTSPSLDRIPNGSVALLYPFPSSLTPDGELWQAMTRMHFKMPGGYFLVPQSPHRTIAFAPTIGYDTDTLTAATLIALAAGSPPPETPQLRAALVAQLRSWQVRTLVASPAHELNRAQSLQFLTWLAGAPPVPGPGVVVWYHLFD